MHRPTFMARAAVALAVLAPLAAHAGLITYTLNDDPVLQNNYHLVGTITTDGHLGAWNANHIVAWEVSLFDPSSNLAFSINSSTPGATLQAFTGDGITSTETSLSVLAGIGGFILAANPTGNANRIGYSPSTDPGRFFGNTAGGAIRWNHVIPTGTSFEIGTADAVVAAVPEPSTIALSLAGLGLAGWISRRTRRPDPASLA